jgi:hypothetical protein
MFTVVLGCGEVCSFTLGSYKREEGIFGTQAYIPMTNTAFHQPQTVEARYVNGLQCAPPRRGTLDVALLSQYVRRMLAFHRWADTPAHLRAALEEHDARNAVITRAAVLKVHQKLMTDRRRGRRLPSSWRGWTLPTVHLCQWHRPPRSALVHPLRKAGPPPRCAQRIYQ